MSDARVSDEAIRVWRCSPGIEMMDIRRSRRCWRVVNDGLCVALARAGATEYRYRGRDYAKTPGTTTVHEPGEGYAARRQHEAGAATVFRVEPSALESWMPYSAHFTPGPGRDVRLARALEALARAVRARDVDAVDERLAAMFAALRTRTEVPPEVRNPSDAREPRAVRLVKEALRADVARNVPLDELAVMVGLHKLYLVAVFRRAVGLPPHAYQLRLRVDRARAMLGAGVPAIEVAHTLGFADQSHLGRHFRGVFGLSPRAYGLGGSPD